MNVLIVDDNEDSATTLGWMVEALGHTFRLAFDGRQAIDAAKQSAPDLVLMDLGLPDMSGYDVCRELRKMKEMSNSILVAQTGWGEENHIRMSKEAGFDYHLVKPVEMQALQNLLQPGGAAASDRQM
jgi:CheY-like chemotaxis protein